MTTALPYVSVVIPVYNDFKRLDACLYALEASSYPAHHLEIIVVDNGSTESLEDVRSNHPAVRWETEEQAGSYAARNRALVVATGEVLAFTDSDCLPHPDWIERGVRALRGAPAECGLAAGRVEVFSTPERRPKAIELYELAHAFPQRTYVERSGFGVTANLFVWRKVVDTIGPFDSTLRSGGDHEFGLRARNAGYGIVYVDDAVVRHPARTSWRAMDRKLRRVIAGDRHLDPKSRWSSGRLLKRVLMSFVPPVRSTIRAVRRSSFGRPIDGLRYGMALTGVRLLTAWHLIRARYSSEAPR